MLRIIPIGTIALAAVAAVGCESGTAVQPDRHVAPVSSSQTANGNGKPETDPSYHVLTGAPGMGNNGTAGEFKAPWKIILLVYNPAYVASRNFTPIKSAADLDAAETAGNVFLPVNPGGENPYEIDTGNLLICPLVSNHA